MDLVPDLRMIDTPRLGAYPRDKHRRVSRHIFSHELRPADRIRSDACARQCVPGGIARCGLCPTAIPQRISRLFLASTRPRRHRTNSNDFVQPFAMGANNEWSLSRRNACRRRRVQHRPAHRRLSVHRSSEPASCRPRALHH